MIHPLKPIDARGAIVHDKRAAGYVDRILPVQRSIKLALVVNLKTAKTLGLDVPQSIMLRADEVVQ